MLYYKIIYIELHENPYLKTVIKTILVSKEMGKKKKNLSIILFLLDNSSVQVQLLETFSKEIVMKHFMSNFF
jgi:hypothetical protein